MLLIQLNKTLKKMKINVFILTSNLWKFQNKIPTYFSVRRMPTAKLQNSNNIQLPAFISHHLIYFVLEFHISAQPKSALVIQKSLV